MSAYAEGMIMNVVYAGEAVNTRRPSLFLAGPAPRRPEVKSWRAEALEALRALSFAGTVLLPEPRDWSAKFSYLDQVEWDCTFRKKAIVRQPN
jgi:hypothetical protein